MGLFDRVRQLLGVGAETAATRDADPEDLFGMSTAYVTMEAELGYAPAGTAALCFSDVDSTAFRDTVAEVREILDASAEEMGTVAEFHEDEYGYQWIVLEASDPEALVTSVHFAADTLIEGRYGSRLLAALFAFEATDRAGLPAGQHVYWVYSFRRGAYYPFAPEPVASGSGGGSNGGAAQERAESVEYKLSGVLDGELAVEDDREYWYPLWPDDPGNHPWE
ncbi:hypothetical protein BRD19_12200 [Halobacteriales archaeon SW_7_65_23]|nr:MAG: hypothetical protein BRD19_12200 [Halobacteriales archaeon SW_7_65_23]